MESEKCFGNRGGKSETEGTVHQCLRGMDTPGVDLSKLLGETKILVGKGLQD